ncbi:MAG: hypothetical protein WCB94_11085 [Terriglobales bacterium]
MRAPGRGWVVALVCLSNFWGASFALAQPSDQVVAERALGPQWKQLSRRAGMIFAGTVLGSTRPTTIDRAVPASIPALQLSFRVDRAIAGVKRGQVLTIREWTGASSMQRPMIKGQHILIFLYPPSRLGLTSPVGGSLGQVALDASGKNVSGAGFANALPPGRYVPQGLKPAFLQARNGTLRLRSGQALEAVPYPKPTAENSRVDTGTVSVVQLERAIRSARSEQE